MRVSKEVKALLNVTDLTECMKSRCFARVTRAISSESFVVCVDATDVPGEPCRCVALGIRKPPDDNRRRGENHAGSCAAVDPHGPACDSQREPGRVGRECQVKPSFFFVSPRTRS